MRPLSTRLADLVRDGFITFRNRNRPRAGALPPEVRSLRGSPVKGTLSPANEQTPYILDDEDLRCLWGAR